MQQAEPAGAFCSSECEDLWAGGKVIRRCKKCNHIFVRPIEEHSLVCPDCYYKEHYAPPKSPSRRMGKKPPKDKINDVIREQMERQNETGRRISYGEIIAKKR